MKSILYQGEKTMKVTNWKNKEGKTSNTRKKKQRVRGIGNGKGREYEYKAHIDRNSRWKNA